MMVIAVGDRKWDRNKGQEGGGNKRDGEGKKEEEEEERKKVRE